MEKKRPSQRAEGDSTKTETKGCIDQHSTQGSEQIKMSWIRSIKICKLLLHNFDVETPTIIENEIKALKSGKFIMRYSEDLKSFEHEGCGSHV